MSRPTRRTVNRALLAAAALPPWATAWGTAAAPAAGGVKRLRYAFPIAETGFDPATISDLYSRTVTAGIFEALLGYEFLARPVRLKPLVAEALPEVSADFRRFTFRLRRGVFFADDPAFGGRRRELTADDFVYAIKRHYDPKSNSPNVYLLENARLLGLSELRRKSLADKTPFPYGAPVEGVKALDRYTLQFNLADPSPRFHQNVLADSSVFGAVAREVVEFYGDKIAAHPVGTGPFRLGEWRRSSRIVLERNPTYREVLYDEQPPPDDAEAVAMAARLKGRRLPLVDRVEISIIEETQPRWLAFLNGQLDVLERLPSEYADIAIPNNQLAPNLARQGITMSRAPLVDVTLATLFNMEHPLVGGNAPEKVALRRAIGLAYDTGEEIRLVRRGQAVPAQTPIAPLTFGYDPSLKTEMSDHDPERAKALLDLFGYVDRNGDGWREMPDGSPLLLEYASQPDQNSRQLAELWQKNMRAVGLRIRFNIAKWPENLKASRAGRLMMWGVAWSAGAPDGDTFLALGFGPNKGQANHARFDLPAFNELYLRQNRLPDGPERQQVMREAALLMVAYMPYKLSSHRIATDLVHPWVGGFRRNPFVREFYLYVDVDAEHQSRQA
jgi:ABC-type transport system substrate-binding protein